MTNTVLITGATGFIGRALCQALASRGGNTLRMAVRHQLPDADASHALGDVVVTGDINAQTNWQRALAGVDAIVHTAARAHILADRSKDPLAEFRRINVDGTLNLARQSMAAGVRRFIHVSSIGVNGNQTPLGQPFTERSPADPQDAYAVSKLESELGLHELLKGSQTELVIIRPPLVYGPGAPGNFRRLLKLAASGLPVPLGDIHNKRSLVALDNLIDLMITCIDHPAAANQIFLVSDGEDLSTTELFLNMRAALRVPPRMLPIPVFILQAGAAVLGRKALAQRLCQSLQLDISKARTLLGWSPPVTIDQALRESVKGDDGALVSSQITA